MHLLTETSKSHHLPVVLTDDVRAYIARALKGEHVSGSDIRFAVYIFIKCYQMLNKLENPNTFFDSSSNKPMSSF